MVYVILEFEAKQKIKLANLKMLLCLILQLFIIIYRQLAITSIMNKIMYFRSTRADPGHPALLHVLYFID